ncbi:MAG TPA: hypothetical protein VMI75_16105 [Polyangiaceae bacterium]|nr:hypothetical protein [Polyangiaceae bacterium]
MSPKTLREASQRHSKEALSLCESVTTHGDSVTRHGDEAMTLGSITKRHGESAETHGEGAVTTNEEDLSLCFIATTLGL